MACPIIRTLNTWREIIQFSALIQTSALCKFTLDDCRERLLDLLLLLARLCGFAAFLALLDGSYAQAAASAIVALLLCPFAVPMLLSLAGSALIVAASAIFAWLFWKQNMTMNLSAAQRFFFFSDSIQKVIKSGYLNLFLPVLSLRNEPTRISCELPHSPAHRFCIFHRSSPSPSTLKPPSVTVKPTRCPTSSAVQRGPTWPWRCICEGSGKQLRVKRNSSHTWANK